MIAYVAVAIVVGVGLCLIAVDYGRAQYARMQLQSCVDGAARAAAGGIPHGLDEARRRARGVGTLSRADGQPITFEDADFRFGRWNDEAEQIEAASIVDVDAVEVVARRTVPLTFGVMFGKPSVDVSARATATWTIDRNYAIIGLDSIHMWGGATVDSYNAASGPYSPLTRRTNGDLGTNGDITLEQNVRVYGDGTYKQNLVIRDSAEFVSPGTARKVRSTFAFSPPTLPATYTSMGSFHGSGPNTLTLASGNYYFTKLQTTGQFTLIVDGQVNVYVNGDVDLEGLAVVMGNKPANLRINVMNDGDVKLAGNGTLHADLFAPLSAVKVAGNGEIFGRLLGKTVTSEGNGGIHYDESLADKFVGTVSIVR